LPPALRPPKSTKSIQKLGLSPRKAALPQESVMQLSFFTPTVLVILIAVAVLLILGAVSYSRMRKGNTFQLRKRFGSEYERAVEEHGSERKAESKLAGRQARVEKFNLRQLGSSQRDRFMTDWRAVESRFLDHPKGAVTEADELVSSLLVARGYPVSGFEQSAEDISVDYPRIIEYYRSAHAIAVRPGNAEASTEELRSAMIDYRTLFDELVQAQAPAEVRAIS
jgi:hypothetical protein